MGLFNVREAELNRYKFRPYPVQEGTKTTLVVIGKTEVCVGISDRECEIASWQFPIFERHTMRNIKSIYWRTTGSGWGATLNGNIEAMLVKYGCVLCFSQILEDYIRD